MPFARVAKQNVHDRLLAIPKNENGRPYEREAPTISGAAERVAGLGNGAQFDPKTKLARLT